MQEHVATITPYALLTAALALVLGNIPVGLGLYGPLTATGISGAVLIAIIVMFGKRPPE